MKRVFIRWACCVYALLLTLGLQAQTKSVRVIWKEVSTQGGVSAKNGILSSLQIENSQGKITRNNTFKVKGENVELIITVDSARIEPGPEATIISLKTTNQAFSFFLRDVTTSNPIYLPSYKVIVTTVEENRTYTEIEEDIISRHLLTKAQQVEKEPEASFESVSQNTRNMSVPMWLGLGRDMRLFEIEEEMNDNINEGKSVKPMNGPKPMRVPQVNNDELRYFYAFGRGVGPHPNVTRSLEDGYLQLYHSSLVDDDITYQSVSFVTGEVNDLSQYDACGSDFLLLDHYNSNRKLTQTQENAIQEALNKENAREGVVLCVNTIIKNNGNVPRYAWVLVPRPGNGWMKNYKHTYDRTTGLSYFDRDNVFCLSLLNDKPVPNEETAILLQPGQEITCRFLLPHRPINMERALGMTQRDYSTHYAAAQGYWQARTNSAARISLPEKRIEDMMKAGLHHLNLITYGNDKTDTYAPTVGIYRPIGTESAPIILYYLSMGWNETAKRSLNYFLAWQHPDGSIQNYGGYMVETGAFLWMAGEYVRYTKDYDWLIAHKDQLLLSCQYLMDWRDKHKIDSIRGRGYGMVDGKFADVPAPYRQFSVNSYNCLGISRMAEALQQVDPEQAAVLAKEAKEWKEDILESLAHQLEITPVVPLGDGTWTFTVSPWAEGEALRALYYQRETFWSHGTFVDSDILSGPHYLMFCEIVDPNSPIGGYILDYTREIFCQGLTAQSQPYYSRHNWMQLQRGEVKQFLNTYYSTMSAQADRQTYSFWEHMYRVSAHKTHEEATFLMNTRWMMWCETGDTLSVFKTIPRVWLEDGKEICLQGVGSYFGKLNIQAKSDLSNNRITASVSCEEPVRKPGNVAIRVPHPRGKTPVEIIGGEYFPENETVLISDFNGQCEVTLRYD